jgi:hypothetical protein
MYGAIDAKEHLETADGDAQGAYGRLSSEKHGGVRRPPDRSYDEHFAIPVSPQTMSAEDVQFDRTAV